MPVYGFDKGNTKKGRMHVKVCTLHSQLLGYSVHHHDRAEPREDSYARLLWPNLVPAWAISCQSLR
jgi:hypothetical protein